MRALLRCIAALLAVALASCTAAAGGGHRDGSSTAAAAVQATFSHAAWGGGVGVEAAVAAAALGSSARAAANCTRPRPHQIVRPLDSAVRFTTRQLDTGAVELVVQHRPVYGVSPSMMVWMWANAAKDVLDVRDGRRYQMFALMHPWDHVETVYSTPTLVTSAAAGGLAGATLLSTLEVPASNCTPQFNQSKSAPIDCQPRERAWSKMLARAGRRACLTMPDAERTNAPVSALNNLVVRYLNASGLDVAMTFENSDNNCTVDFGVLNTRYEYTARRMRLAVTHTYTYGIATTKECPAATKDDVVMANQMVLGSIAGRTGGDWRKTLAYMALHVVQEVGFLPEWLPMAYRLNRSP